MGYNDNGRGIESHAPERDGKWRERRRRSTTIVTAAAASQPSSIFQFLAVGVFLFTIF